MYLKLLKMEMKKTAVSRISWLLIYKGLFILAEDWEPEQILPAIEEMDAAEVAVKELL